MLRLHFLCAHRAFAVQLPRRTRRLRCAGLIAPTRLNSPVELGRGPLGWVLCLLMWLLLQEPAVPSARRYTSLARHVLLNGLEICPLLKSSMRAQLYG